MAALALKFDRFLLARFRLWRKSKTFNSSLAPLTLALIYTSTDITLVSNSSFTNGGGASSGTTRTLA